ncbi:MAG: amino acid permease [Candidatus Cloacimonetes bacterium]|nr:amino acid permease [Candidatus Cloacimonadota bacterium]
MALKKELGFFGVFSIASGAMISSGIFILPGIAYQLAGPSIFVSYFLAGLLAMTGVFSIAELSTAMPKAGGDYFFITRSLGSSVGTISGLLSWFALSLKSAFGIIGIVFVLKMILPSINMQLFSIIFTAGFVLVNLAGVKEAGKLQAILVVFLLGLMLTYIIAGAGNINVNNLVPFIPVGKNINIIFTTAGFVFVSYGGLLKVASMSEEIIDPKRNIPFALISSLIVAMLLYSAMILVTVGVMGDRLILPENINTPIAQSAKEVLGVFGYWSITLASMLAFITTANAGIMAASRYPLALGRDGLLPEFIAKTDKRHSPYISIILTGLFIAIALMINLEVLIKAASTVIIMNYILSHISVIILRESRMQNYKPSFKSPLYPWVQFVGIIAFVLLISDMGLKAILISVGLIVIGFMVYMLYGRKRSNQEYALLHLVERIVNKKLTGYNLESELKDILYQRDEIDKDGFDYLIEKAVVLDIKEQLTLKELFSRIANTMSTQVDLSREQIQNSLWEREEQSPTALTPFLAVPHLILEGENRFQIILVRTIKGTIYNEQYQAVKAIFVLAGTMDRRNNHLRALASIAQVVHHKDFEKKWLSARGSQELKDLVLLSDRKRNSQ